MICIIEKDSFAKVKASMLHFRDKSSTYSFSSSMSSSMFEKSWMVDSFLPDLEDVPCSRKKP